MTPKNSIDAENKKKARDDALEFLETLKISDGANSDNGGASKDANDEEVGSQDKGPSARADEDPKSMLKFIDDLTESAKRGSAASEEGDSDARKGDTAKGDDVSATGGGWSWGGLWGQAAALVEQNEQFKSGLGKLKESFDNVRNTEASKSLESRVKTFVSQESINRLGGDLKRSLDTVIDTIAPPIQEHEAFSIHLVDNVSDSNIESVVYRTMDAVFDFHDAGEINVKSAAEQMREAPEMQTKRGDTFTLPKGFDGGYGAAMSAIQFIQNTEKITAKERAGVSAKSSSSANANGDASTGEGSLPGEETDGLKRSQERSPSPLFYRAHKTELFLAVQPFSVIPIEDQGFLGLCVVLRDAQRNITLRTFSQMLPLSCWAKPHDQIVAVDIDASLGSAVNMRTDSVVQRKQEMNEECLYEAVMLGVKTLCNEYLTTRPQPDATGGLTSGAIAASTPVAGDVTGSKPSELTEQ
ncbi:hypothetical protein GGI11_006295 [Coemansia sp. RSA 2049]|nr:hypothetical protein GGI11_006295 [Coemansia sp. RSA 2049]KAJ2510640.1 hypothetical protein H4217_007770 [Coemansia sp. RSA 1939]KAJ2684206.1 hypothetical protein GGH99_004124 [Coemansia sp. RSA 1285]